MREGLMDDTGYDIPECIGIDKCQREAYERGIEDAFELVKNLILNKQSAVKPVCYEDKVWACPICKNNLMHKWVKYPTIKTPLTEGLSYCMNCGQRLNWSVR